MGATKNKAAEAIYEYNGKSQKNQKIKHSQISERQNRENNML